MESCKRPVELRRMYQAVSNMAVGRRPMLTKLLARWCKKNLGNLQIIFWAEKLLRSGRTTGLNMQTFGRASMTEQNISCPGPGKSRIGKTQYLSKAWQISKRSKGQKVPASRFGA